jgi:hypothetical protein
LECRKAPAYISNYMAKKRDDREKEDFRRKRMRLDTAVKMQEVATSKLQRNVQLYYAEDDPDKIPSEDETDSDEYTDALSGVEEMSVDENLSESRGSDAVNDADEEEA